MSDMEKVIFQLSETYKVLEIVTPHFNQIMDYEGMIQGCKDAIALLKEQEAVEPTKSEDGELFCGNCGDHIGTEPYSSKLPVLIMNYCPSCGRRVAKQNIPIHKDWWLK